jgi:hypothetical protein
LSLVVVEICDCWRDSHDPAGSKHAHSVLLGASGKVVAIGADKEACMVDFGPIGVHKMLVGRKVRSSLTPQAPSLLTAQFERA